jgi:hypothetical protein
MAMLLAPHLEWLPVSEREKVVDFALRAATSVLQQRLVFGDIEVGRFRLSESEMTQRLADQFLATLTVSRPVTENARKSARPRNSHRRN